MEEKCMEEKYMEKKYMEKKVMEEKRMGRNGMEKKCVEERNMEDKQKKTVNMLTLAFGIAFMPPIWAVLAPFIGIGTGSVALICAGLFVANGNRRQDTVKISVGLPIMGPMQVDGIGTLPIQIGVAMLVGVIYVGVGVDAFQGMLVRRLGCGDGGNGVPDTH